MLVFQNIAVNYQNRLKKLSAHLYVCVCVCVYEEYNRTGYSGVNPSAALVCPLTGMYANKHTVLVDNSYGDYIHYICRLR